MILRRLKATNFQRYKELELANLPERGVIGVVGANESGKSTIGDAVAFALFGQTIRADGGHLKDVVNWQEDTAMVRLAFRLDDGAEYEVVREVDKEGTYFAELCDLATGQVIVRGVGKVQRRLDELIDFSFDEFRYSFYLGQKEFDILGAGSGGDRRRMLDGMIGVTEIEEALSGVRDRLGGLSAERDQIDRELGMTARLVTEYRGTGEGTDPCRARLQEAMDRVAALEATLGTCEQESARTNSLFESLEMAHAAVDTIVMRRYVRLLAHVGAAEKLCCRALTDRMSALEAESSSLTTQCEAFRTFQVRLGELESLVRLRAEELAALLKNNLEGVYSDAEGDLITPDGKREQLVVTERRIEETIARSKQANRGLRLLFVPSILATIVGAVMLYHCGGLVLSTPLVCWTAVFLGGLTGLAMAWRRRCEIVSLERRRSRLEMNRSILQEEVAQIRRALEACKSFDRTDVASMAERVRQTQTPRILELYDRIVAAHREFLVQEAVVPTYQETLSQSISTANLKLCELQKQRQELEEFERWLDLALGGLRSSGFASSVEVNEAEVVPVWTYEFLRDQKAACVTAVTEASRHVYALESSGLKAVDDPLSLIRGKMGEVSSGGARPPEEIAVDLANLRVGPGESTVSDVLSRLRALGLELKNGLLPKQAVHESEERNRNRREGLMGEVQAARIARETASLELKSLEPDIHRSQELASQQEALEAKRRAVHRQIRVHEVLGDMLSELADRLRRRCGPAISEFIAWVLPRLTSGRYETVRLSRDFEMEIYARERGDYVGLDCLSGGTVDQLLLALRLAFAKALIHTKRSPEYQQYLFFDEPFSSFDEDRAESFVRLLKRPDLNFVQIFLVSHLPGLARHCDLVVQTRIDQPRLVVG